MMIWQNAPYSPVAVGEAPTWLLRSSDPTAETRSSGLTPPAVVVEAVLLLRLPGPSLPPSAPLSPPGPPAGNSPRMAASAAAAAAAAGVLATDDAAVETEAPREVLLRRVLLGARMSSVVS